MWNWSLCILWHTWNNNLCMKINSTILPTWFSLQFVPFIRTILWNISMDYNVRMENICVNRSLVSLISLCLSPVRQSSALSSPSISLLCPGASQHGSTRHAHTSPSGVDSCAPDTPDAVRTAQFHTILNKPSVIIIQMRINTYLPESMPRVIPHLETRITDTSFI